MNKERKQLITDVMRKNGAVVGYLFGSHARGTAGPLSDIDVAVIFPVNMSIKRQEDNIESIRGGLERIYGIDRVDVLNLGQAVNPSIRHITMFDEGISLFNDDRPLANRLAFQTMKEYEDTFVIRRNQREVLGRLFAHQSNV